MNVYPIDFSYRALDTDRRLYPYPHCTRPVNTTFSGRDPERESFHTVLRWYGTNCYSGVLSI